jgi:general secretion pathway protein A
MYEAFFGLRQKPFALQTDTNFIFDAKGYRAALTQLQESFASRVALSVVTGEMGCGKTTLIHGFLSELGDDINVGLIAHTNPSFRNIAPWALVSFDQRPVGAPAEAIQQQLMLYLIAEYANGRRSLLIIDEAQNLTTTALEELHALSTLSAGDELLLQIVMVGQPEFLETLKDPQLASFAERISIRHNMPGLAFAETGPYVRSRLAMAGAEQPIFTESAIAALHFFSEGTPRLINMLGDLAMVYAFGNDQPVVDLDLILRVVADRKASGIAAFAHMDSLEHAETQIIALLVPDAPPDSPSEIPEEADLILTEELPPLPAPEAIEAGVLDSAATALALPDSRPSDASASAPAQVPDWDPWQVDPSDVDGAPQQSAQVLSDLLAAHRVTSGREGLGRPIDPRNDARTTAKPSLRRRFLPRDENNG